MAAFEREARAVGSKMGCAVQRKAAILRERILIWMLSIMACRPDSAREQAASGKSSQMLVDKCCMDAFGVPGVL